MDRREFIINSLKEFKKNLSKKIKIDKMIVFGSLARGKFTKDSDIDLIIVSKKFRKIAFHKRAITFDRYWKLDYPFDFICLSPEEYKKMRKGVTIVSLAEKEGIAI
jgi:predicted nucleotidyltransferase